MSPALRATVEVGGTVVGIAAFVAAVDGYPFALLVLLAIVALVCIVRSWLSRYRELKQRETVIEWPVRTGYTPTAPGSFDDLGNYRVTKKYTSAEMAARCKVRG